MEYRLLSTACEYRKDRISADEVNENNYISTENMLPNRGGVETASSVAEGKTFPVYKEGDILLSNIRPYFKKIWFADKKGGCSNDVLVLKANKSVDKRFLYYVLSDNNFFNYSTVTSKGTKMPRGSKTAIMKYLVPDVDMPTQKRIADILSAYDDLIENNNRRIALLEKAAQELYKEWFVRFRFPGHETAKFENGLPKGWEVKKLSQISDFVYGKMPKADLISETGYPVFSGYRVSGYYPEYMYEDRQLVLIARGVGGTGDVKLSPPKSYITNLSIVFLLKSNMYQKYLYYAYSLNNLRYLDTGAAQSQITIENLKRVKVFCPDSTTLEKFNGFVQDIERQIQKLLDKNQILAKQRDLLLPRLMSGKLEV